VFELRGQAAPDTTAVDDEYRRTAVPLPIHVAIVSLTTEVSTRSLLQATAAVQKQVTRDFAPIWGIPATVDAFDNLESIPTDYLPVIIFGDPSELADELEALIGPMPAARLLDAFERDMVTGVHLNAVTRQPFALVSAENAWTVTTSHEVLEMLSDPSGNRLVASPHPTRPGQRVDYLIEVCDPCLSQWYPVNGLPVADFYTPRYFDPVGAPGVRYSYTGSIDRPRKVLEGGYLTFVDPTDSKLYQQHSGDADPIELAGLEEMARSAVPLRTFVDTNPRTPRVNPELLRGADTATAIDHPYQGVSDAARASALSTAEAVYSLAMGLG
jgi:hypothetical protein